MTEPQITIDGVDLSPAQAMAVRVAISNFYAELEQPGALGNDEHGLLLAKAYRERLVEVLAIILRGPSVQ